MNWRKSIILGFLHVSSSRINSNLKSIHNFEFMDKKSIRKMQNQKLEKLLLHAHEHVPYYSSMLEKHGVVVKKNVSLDNFTNLPLLTKDIIRREGSNLYATNRDKLKPYINTSGGSTGEPLEFLQDKNYDDWNIATKLYFNRVLGKEVGEREIKLWGSDRDIIAGNLTIKERLMNYLYNRRFFNCYRFGPSELESLIELNNRFKPKAYWIYMEAGFELAKYLKQSKKEFHAPCIVISTIGPLTEHVKQTVEQNLNCKVYNQYGSREVGAIASQCTHQGGLHTFPWWNVVEILNQNNQRLEEGQGRVVLTTLENYSMPLIRYDIGDVAIAGGWDCPCGRHTFLLKELSGRTLGFYKKEDGSLVHSHFLVQSLFFRDWIKRFQIIQDEYNHILINIELRTDKKPDEEDIKDITKKTKLLMGDNCAVDFQFVDCISRTASGKYVYTLCKVK